MMKIKIDLNILRFDVKKDYLPYNYKHTIIAQDHIKLSEFYRLLAEEIIDFGYEENSIIAKINQVIVHEDLEIGILCERFGYQWQLESFAPKATSKDLIVNRSLINQSIQLVESIQPLTEEERQIFDSLLPFCFITPISHSIENYLGEGFFIFVALMAKAHPQKASSLFELVSNPSDGVMNAMLLKNRIFPEIDLYDQELLAMQQALLKGYPLYTTYWTTFTQTLKDTIK